MSKFAVGEMVDSAADVQEGGTIVAVFPTIDGSFRYAVDTEGYGASSFSPRKNWSFTPPARGRTNGAR